VPEGTRHLLVSRGHINQVHWLAFYGISPVEFAPAKRTALKKNPDTVWNGFEYTGRDGASF
jgi:hypothetical protein